MSAKSSMCRSSAPWVSASTAIRRSWNMRRCAEAPAQGIAFDNPEPIEACGVTLLRIIAPEPAHRVRQQRGPVLRVMRSFTDDKLMVVALFVQRCGHRLVRLGP